MILARQIIFRRPLSSLTASISVGALGYANYLEWRASNSNNQSSSSAVQKSIPRCHYDPHSIASYWEQRPISVMKRLVSIAVELGPVTCEYMIDFHFRPWLRRSLSLSLVDAEADNAEEVVEEERIQKHEMERSLSSRLRSSLTKLGPTFIKVGQQLSIRPDLISPTALYELQKLCDAVPPFDDEIAMKVLAEELASSMRKRRRDVSNLMDDKEEVEHTILQVFEEMPTLIASASLGQVYKAKLRSLHNNNNDEAASKQVAIKIQRPDVLEVVTLDLFLLVSYGKFVDKLFTIITNQIPYHEMFLNTFASGAYMELNYINEADNQTFFRNELHSRFHGNTNTNKKHSSSSRLLQLFQNRHRVRGRTHAEKVMVPKVYNEYTTERILVSEWIDGIPLARAPPEQIRKLIPIGVELFLCQLLDIGRFHADPHPGGFDNDNSIKFICVASNFISPFDQSRGVRRLERKLIRDNFQSRWRHSHTLPTRLWTNRTR